MRGYYCGTIQPSIWQIFGNSSSTFFVNTILYFGFSFGLVPFCLFVNGRIAFALFLVKHKSKICIICFPSSIPVSVIFITTFARQVNNALAGTCSWSSYFGFEPGCPTKDSWNCDAIYPGGFLYLVYEVNNFTYYHTLPSLATKKWSYGNKVPDAIHRIFFSHQLIANATSFKTGEHKKNNALNVSYYQGKLIHIIWRILKL